MADGYRRFRIIPAEEAVEHTVWETPDVEEPARRRRQAAEEARLRREEEARRQRRRLKRRRAVKERLRREDEARRALPTEEEIEALREAARKMGYQEGHREGREAGYQDGHDAGFQQGEEEGRRSGAALVQRLQVLLDTLGRPLERLDDETEDELLQLVFTVARRMVLEELRTHPEPVQAAVHQALRELPANHRQVAVHLHPEDLPFIEEQMGAQAAGEGWSLVSDSAVTRGGCVIATETSRVDATVERRIDAVAAQLFGDPTGDDLDPVVRETFRGEVPSQADPDPGPDPDPDPESDPESGEAP